MSDTSTKAFLVTTELWQNENFTKTKIAFWRSGMAQHHRRLSRAELMDKLKGRIIDHIKDTNFDYWETDDHETLEIKLEKIEVIG